MSLIKKIALRLIMLIGIVLLCNVIYTHTTYQSDLKSEGNVLPKFERVVDVSDALYFSASPNAAIHKDDSDKRTICEMMDDLTPEMRINAVDTGGIHAGVFRKLIRRIPEDSPVKCVVVNMNYRSFGIDWIESALENAIQKQTVFYNPYPPIVNRFLQGLNYYETKTDAQRQKIIQDHWKNDTLSFDYPRDNVTNWCAVEKWGDWTNPKRQLADAYIKNFAFTLSDENPRIQDFDEIVRICKEKKLRLIFVILPENLEEAKLLVGEELIQLMIENKNELVNRYTSMGAEVVDCFSSASDSLFTERYFPSEHYNQTGRMIVASAVAACLSK